MAPASLAAIFTVAVLLALLFGRLRLPPVLAYVGTGLVLGPSLLAWFDGHERWIEIAAEIGVMLLLFTVGLEMSLRELLRSWRAVLVGGSLQVTLSCALSVAIGALFGLPWRESLVWGYLLSLSSTAVVLGMLDARGETRAIHGRLVIGILLFQDLAVVPMMLSLPMLAREPGGGGGLISLLSSSLLLPTALVVASIWVVPRLLRWVALSRNRELFLLSVLAIAGVTAWLTSLAGLSLALGAFVAGVVLAETQYAHQALADVLPFRTVTLCVFFVSIGMLLDPAALAEDPIRAGSLLLAIVLGKFVVGLLVGMALRFPVQVSVLAATALAQIGEFSFVLAGEATEHDLISEPDRQLFLAASVLSIALAPLVVSTFPRLLAGSLALRPLERLLDRERQLEQQAEEDTSALSGHVIVAGLGVGGRTAVTALERASVPVLIVELNPETVSRERGRGRRVVYGDVTSPDVLSHAGIASARLLLLVTSDLGASHRAAVSARQLRPDLPIVIRTRFASDEGSERYAGFDVVSEEFAGAVAVTSAVLARCGLPQPLAPLVAELDREHQALKPGEEGDLGPTPGPAERA